MRCSSCSTENPEAARFCLHCGTSLVTSPVSVCKRCHSPLHSEARFCSACGAEAPLSPDGAPVLNPNALQESLQRYLPTGYVEKLLAAKGHVEGERRVVTILFSDVKGSTALGERLDPEEVLEIMNDVFKMLIGPITRYEGTLARLMGDAIMAFFGAPIAHEDDPHRACRAALEIVEGAAQMAKTLEEDRGISGFNVRVGINTGLVVVAEVGADLRVEYTAMGDAVNLAARMESLAEPGSILITEATRRAIGNAFRTKSIGPVSVKGKSEQVSVFQLIGVPGAEHPVMAHKVRSTLVGRDSELRRLREKISGLSNRPGGICAIVGEAGLGKSRLVQEARNLEGSHCLWAEALALPYTQNTSYATVRQLLSGMLAGRPDESHETLVTLLRRNLEERSPVIFPEIFPYLSLLLGRSPEGDMRQRLHSLDPELLRQRIYHAFSTYLRLIASERPVVLVCEDLHWVDPSSLAVLESLLPLLAESPVLGVVTYRHGESRAQEFSAIAKRVCGTLFETIELEPLPRAESSTLLANLLKGCSLSSHQREEILQKTDGNAFFLEEVVRQLFDSEGASVDHSSVSQLDTDGGISIPVTLRGVITARIDRLAPANRQVLQTASVLGRTFGTDLLALMLAEGITRGDYEASIEDLIQRGFLRVMVQEGTVALESAIGKELTFTHSLTQTVAYDGLLLSQRRLLHRRAVEAIERLHGSDVHFFSAQLATHCEMAGDKEKALQYLSQAAILARDVFANQEAVGLFTRALELAAQLGSAAEHVSALHEGLADVLAYGTSYAHALGHYKQAEERASDSLQHAVLLRKQGLVLEKIGRYDEALQSFEAALNHLRSTANSKEAARIFTGLGRIYSHRGDMQSAIDLSLLALDVTRDHADDWGIAHACNNLGIIYAKAGDTAKALEHHRKSMEIWSSLAESHGLAVSHNNIGLVYHRLNNLDKAAEHFRTSIELSERTGNLLGIARACDNLGQVLALDGRTEEAAQLLGRAVGILSRIGLGEDEPNPELWLQSGVW